jgi:hypothetical protein
MTDSPTEIDILDKLNADIAAETDRIAELRDGIRAVDDEIALRKAARQRWVFESAPTLEGFFLGVVSMAGVGKLIAWVIGR